MRCCAKCGTFGQLTPIHEHHIIPKKGWGGKDENGRLLLCQKCHNILTMYVLAHVGRTLETCDPALWKKFRKFIKSYTFWWMKNVKI